MVLLNPDFSWLKSFVLSGGFLSMLLSTLGASLLGSLLSGKGIIRAGEGVFRAGDQDFY